MSQTPSLHTPPTVAEVIAYAELRAGDPLIFASETALKTPVAWVHVLTAPSAVALLDGGELVLTTGAGWPTSDTEIKVLTQELITAGVSAIVLELGAHFTEVPAALREVCRAHDIAVVGLQAQVRFVQITQRVHKRILAAQNVALEARAQVHQMLNQLGLNHSPVDFVVEQLSATMACPIVLENIAGEVITWAAPGIKTTAAEVLNKWANFDPSTSERVPVEAQGKTWGALTALPGPDHAAGRRTVLELGAFALALSRLSNPHGDEWLRLSSKHLIDTILSGRYRHDTELHVQLEAAGLPLNNRDLTALLLVSENNFGSHESLEKAILETALRRTVAPDGKIIITDARSLSDLGFDTGSAGVALLAIASFPAADERASGHASDPPAFAKILARELDMLVPMGAPKNWSAHLSLGVMGHGVTGLLASVKGVADSGLLPAWRSIGRVSVQVAAKQPLTYLLRSFAGSPALQTFTTEQLGPLLEYDKKSGPGFSGDLMRVLEAYLATPNNRSKAASAARLSRSVFYARLELIEELLGVDLAAGDTIAALATAVTAHKI